MSFIFPFFRKVTDTIFSSNSWSIQLFLSCLTLWGEFLFSEVTFLVGASPVSIYYTMSHLSCSLPCFIGYPHPALAYLYQTFIASSRCSCFMFLFEGFLFLYLCSLSPAFIPLVFPFSFIKFAFCKSSI